MKVDLSHFQPSLSLDDRRMAVDPETRRIAVRIASWDDVHSGFGPAVRQPRNVNVDAAHIGQALLSDGSSIRVATLPAHTTHAPKDLSAMHAASWYENTGTGVARVRYSTDEHGLRADGVLFDDVDDAMLERLLASAPSGDWRSAVAVRKPTDFENTPADLVGACMVNVPGFSDTYSKAEGQRFALVASANTIMSIEDTAVKDDTKPDEQDDVVDPAGVEDAPDDAVVEPGEDDPTPEPDADALQAAAALIASQAAEQGVEPADLVSTLVAAAQADQPVTRAELNALNEAVHELSTLVASSIINQD